MSTVQTVYCYYFTAHSTTWTLDPEVYPFEDRPQHIMDTIRPLEPVTWVSVPLALRGINPCAAPHLAAQAAPAWRTAVHP